LVLWKLPEGTAQWRIDEEVRVVDFSPDRAFVQLHLPKQEKYSWLEVRTGEWKGDMPGGSRWTADKLAVSPDRTRVASLTTASGYSRLMVKEVTGEGPGNTFDIPSASGPITWLDDRYLLTLGTGVVFDSTTGAPLSRL